MHPFPEYRPAVCTQEGDGRVVVQQGQEWPNGVCCVQPFLITKIRNRGWRVLYYVVRYMPSSVHSAMVFFTSLKN